MLEILFIGIGGFIGAVARHMAVNFIHNKLVIHDFPVGILIVNIIGCLIIGVLSGIVETKDLFSENIRSLIFIGLLGSFTTFSTFSKDTFSMISNGNIAYAMLNVLVSVLLGLLFVWLGYHIVKMF